MKKILDCVVLATWAMFLMLTLLASLSSGEVIRTGNNSHTFLTEDFEQLPIGFEFSSDKLSVTPSGRTFLGPFGAESVSVVIPMFNNYHVAGISFDVYAIGEWEPDPLASWMATQTMSGNDVVQLLTASHLLNYLKRTETDTLGYDEPDRVYHFQTWFVGDGRDWYRAEFTGHVPGMLWGLDNVVVVSDFGSAPEPGSGILLAICGIALLIARFRGKMDRNSKNSENSLSP